MTCENSARKRSKTMAFRCTPEERKLICEMAAWSGMNRQDYIIAKLTNTKVEVKPSVSVQKALRDSMTELIKEVRLAVSYGELSESLQQRVELVMGFFLVLGGGVTRRRQRYCNKQHLWRSRRRQLWMQTPTSQASSGWGEVNSSHLVLRTIDSFIDVLENAGPAMTAGITGPGVFDLARVPS